MKTTLFLIATMLATSAVQADGFMDYETERARITEANGECEINSPLGADKQACVSAYLCTNYGDCEGEGMQPLEPLPGGGVYRDNVGGASNGN
jgi:hypothetical protein